MKNMRACTCIRLLGVLRQTYHRFDRHRIPEISAGATFFILLAIFPAFASIVTLYGLVADRSSISHVLTMVSGFLPRGALIVLNDELHRLIAQDVPRLGFTVGASSILAVWSASGGLKAIMYGLNIAYDVQETRGFLHRSMFAFFFTSAAIFLCVLAITVATILPMLAQRLPFHSLLRAIIPVLGWPVALCFSLVTLATLYRYGPNHKQAWRALSWGSVLSSSLWLMGTFMFKWYVRNFGNFDRVYGNLGAVVGFLVWIWLSLVIMLFGAELNSLLEDRDNNATH